MSIRHLLAIHQATHPGWHNQRHRDEATAALLDHDNEAGSRDRHPTFAAQPKVSSRELLAALDQEIEEENRPHPGPAGDDDGRRSRFDDTTSPEDNDSFEEEDHP